MKLPKWGRILVKLGTQVVIDDQGRFAAARVGSIVRDVAAGPEPILVTSGAVGLGRTALGLQGRKLELGEKQVCAAVGQPLLMKSYSQVLARSSKKTSAQMLVTADDLTDRQRYLNFSETLNKLLNFGALPVINENDSISTAELRDTAGSLAGRRSFGDNDKLSAIVAAKMRVDLLIILSNIDGFYTANPKHKKDARRISLVDDLSKFNEIESGGTSSGGTGGIVTKIEAAKIAAMNGVHTIVADGFQKNVIKKILALREWSDSAPGTLVLPRKRLSERKAWIGFSANTRGTIVVNAGAATAILERGASLLPVGIVSISGEFTLNSIVSIVTESGQEIGRGIVEYSSQELKPLVGKKASEAIHKDNLVTYKEADRA